MTDPTGNPDNSEQHENKTPVRLPPGQQLVAADRWPLVGERDAAPQDGPWTLNVAGLAVRPYQLNLEQLSQLPQTQLTIDIHCVTRWSKFDVTFGGIRLQAVLNECDPQPDARFVSFVAHTARKHSSSMPLDEALRLGALLATSVDGKPLPAKHGGPLRVVLPGKYFYKSVKWLQQIELLGEDRLGFWESEAGYHNGADPWLEQRYIAGSIDRREAARLIESRDFTGKDLLSLDASGHDLCQLTATGAQLRNANFSTAQLALADFRHANLSNANFRNADLQAADFTEADLEGADFAAADLRGANLRGCSLFGASFCDLDPDADAVAAAAKIDASTQIDADSLGRLTIGQREFVERCLETSR